MNGSASWGTSIADSTGVDAQIFQRILSTTAFMTVASMPM
jgi:hypothetical protein